MKRDFVADVAGWRHGFRLVEQSEERDTERKRGDAFVLKGLVRERWGRDVYAAHDGKVVGIGNFVKRGDGNRLALYGFFPKAH